MATFDELRLQELLKSFNNQGDNTGITSIDQQYTDPKYTYDGLYQENYGDYGERMDPTMDPYGLLYGTKASQPSKSSAFPLDFYGSKSAFAPRIGLPNQVSQINNQNQDTQLFDPTNIQSLIDSAALKNTKLQNFDTSYGVANEADEEQDQDYINQVNKNNENGIMQLVKSLMPGSILSKIAPQDPRATGIRNFYSPEGLTSTGSVASGIMKDYNPVYGGFLNMITGGKFGKPTQYGLSGAMQRRIENILGRRAPQTDASRSKLTELRNLQKAEMQDRSGRGESLGSIGRSTFSGPGMAFEKQSGGSSGKKGTSSERNYGGR